MRIKLRSQFIRAHGSIVSLLILDPAAATRYRLEDDSSSQKPRDLRGKRAIF